MAERHFMEMLKARWALGNFVCVGLDSELEKIPACVKSESICTTILEFNKRIIDACCPHVCAFKPNLAFYLCHGEEGLRALRATVMFIHFSCPEVPVILDAKWADIGNTNIGYVKMAFEYVGADAVTVHPYLGREALKPFLDLPNRGVIILCRTSNPGAGEFQDLESKGAKLYRLVARSIADNWNKNGNCAVVAGATYPTELAEIRQIVDKMPILIPGIGAQGGDLEATVKAGQDNNGSGMIINSSRGIIFAGKGEDFANAAEVEAKKLHDEINKFRKCS